LVEVVCREDDDPGRGRGGVRAEDAAGGSHVVRARHADVHQHDVGERASDDDHGLLAVGRLTDDLDAVRGEDHPEARADECLVVGDHHPGPPYRASRPRSPIKPRPLPPTSVKRPWDKQSLYTIDSCRGQLR
jgi:hypothetical protein